MNSMIPVTFVHSFITFLSTFLAYAFVVTCAGWFSAWVALKLGDDTPAQFGYLTWHPLAHIDIIGALSFLFLGLGWGRMMIFNHHNLSRPWKILVAYLAALPVYIGLALVSLATLIRFFGVKFTTMPSVIFKNKIAALNLFYAMFPEYSSLEIIIGFILLSVVYISVILATLDVISRGFRAGFVILYPERADQMYTDVRLFFIPLILMILFIEPVFSVIHSLVVGLAPKLAQIIG